MTTPKLSFTLLYKRLCNALYGLQLIRAATDVTVHLKRPQVLSVDAAVHHALELILAEESIHFSLRIKGVVPQERFKSVGVKDDRALAVHGLQTIGVQLGLVLSCPCFDHCLFGLDHCQRFAVAAPKDVIDIPIA